MLFIYFLRNRLASAYVLNTPGNMDSPGGHDQTLAGKRKRKTVLYRQIKIQKISFLGSPEVGEKQKA